MIKPFDVNFDTSKNEFLDSLSKHALKLYEKKCDIKNFTKLVLSDPENIYRAVNGEKIGTIVEEDKS